MSVTSKDEKVKIIFKEPFAAIEKLVKLAKKEIAQVGLAEFKSAIISSQDRCIESIKKEPEAHKKGVETLNKILDIPKQEEKERRFGT